MAWIESHQSLSRHRKTLAAAALLKVDRHKLIGHLHELWWWGLDNADSAGLIGSVTDEVLAEAADWPVARAAAFVEVLTRVGFLDVEDDGLRLHDWEDYSGKLQSRKDSNRERMRRARATHESPDPPSTNGARAQHVQRTNGARAQHVTRTVRERAELQERRVEKSREPESTGTPSASAEASTHGVDAAQIVGELRHHTWSSNAGELHDQVTDYLERRGFVCQREYPVADRGDGRAGRVDLIARRGEVYLAIEIDAVTVRQKSGFKLAQIEGAARVVLLRGEERPVFVPNGVDLVGFLPGPKASSDSEPRGRAARRTEIDDAFCHALEAEYAEAFGSIESVRDEIADALSHKARAKRTDQRAYLRNWLRQDAERATLRRNGRNGLALVEPVACECEQLRGDLKINPNSSCVCPVHGYLAG